MRCICLPALLLLAAVLPLTTRGAEALHEFPSSVLSVRTHQSSEWFNVWIADNPQRQQQGLMYQKWLPADWGMLFPDQTPRVKSMWMKNTLIPLDMLFIDPKGRIVYIRERATPQSEEIITFPVAVKAVLELQGGECSLLGIRVGDQVHHPLFGSAPEGPARN